MDNYKEASRLRLRFPSSVGQLNVEQLRDLKLSELTSLVKELKKQFFSTLPSNIKYITGEKQKFGGKIHTVKVRSKNGNN